MRLSFAGDASNNELANGASMFKSVQRNGLS
jgi:hypothetical protein